MINKEELQKQAKYHFDEFQKLKLQLEELNQTDKKSRFKKTQGTLLEEFKQKYTVEVAESFPQINFQDVEEKIFSEDNLANLAANSEGYSLTYNELGMPGFSFINRNGYEFTTFAYDQRDAEIYLERVERMQKMKRTK